MTKRQKVIQHVKGLRQLYRTAVNAENNSMPIYKYHAASGTLTFFAKEDIERKIKLILKTVV